MFIRVVVACMTDALRTMRGERGFPAKRETSTKGVFSRHNVLNDHSHSVNEIDDAHKKKKKKPTNLSTFQWKEFTVAFCELWPG